MGAAQSASNTDSSPGSAATKTCYYELIGVERGASDTEIKKAYRKRALELHPDRNFGDVAAATQKFAELQSAYEVLSDPHERAWYDSHRDAILSGQDETGDGAQSASFRNIRMTSTEEIMSLIRKFNANVPFNDDPIGFFTVVRDTFEHLALEEEAVAEQERVDVVDYPTFGQAQDNYDEIVRPFYATWAGFATRKTFVWKDKYRLSDAPDRRVRRLMEKENKKLRDDAIREFNDAIRFLVAFVRRRDPRYLPNTQTEAERQQTSRVAAAAQAARSRAANQDQMADYKLPEWAVSRDNRSDEGEFSVSEAESEIEILECVMRKEGVEFQLGENPPRTAEGGGKLEFQGTNDVPESTGADMITPCSHIASDSDHSGCSVSHPHRYSDDDDDYAPRSAVMDRIANDQQDAQTNSASPDGCEVDKLSASVLSMSVTMDNNQKKIGKARAKRERKAAAAKASTSSKHICAQDREEERKIAHVVGITELLSNTAATKLRIIARFGS
ncbi:hypothetical protein NQ176_g602 [Zarea fungicola]|uniref:Uncharacterized protein n=1 Tax=Zarea fungicola TaxID=93591 RepID=A0ACC1NYC9_9HYPO|nr:hypothetical protein NQ176_g602 [Lecanicillium fungicola]